MQRVLILLIMLALAAGCADVEARRHANELQTMRQDDEYCLSQGLHYPDPTYIDCRYRVQDARAFRQWRSLQMANSAAKPQALAPPPVHNPVVNFHALNRDRFTCWPEPQFGGTYIFCGERNKLKP